MGFELGGHCDLLIRGNSVEAQATTYAAGGSHGSDADENWSEVLARSRFDLLDIGGSGRRTRQSLT